ncbi:MAG: IPT/TIG domain-containing protein, partial [Dehalococcoidia bacterium]
LAVCFVTIALPAVPARAQDAHILLSPNDGVPGEEITVYGYNFTPDRWVDIYYDTNGDGEFTEDEWVIDERADDYGYFQVDFNVPESYTGDHEVLAEDTYGVEASDYFDVEPGLIIDPEEGPVGTTVAVEGHGFAEEEENMELLYYLDGTAEVVEDNIEANKDGYWQASFQVPSSAMGDHYINAQGDDTELKDVEDVSFEIAPEIEIDLDILSGTVGESIAITGSGFDSEDNYIKVLFAGEEAETEPEIIRADENGDWEATFKVPDMPAGTYIVTAEGQSTGEEDVNNLTFTIAPGLLLSPGEGHVGMNLTVTGGGFTPDEVVVIKYDGGEVETARTDEGGGLEASFLVPESKHGTHNVTAEVGGETETSATFIMESDPPDIPELISPPEDDRVGFIGKVRPTFEWSEVSDDSGVYYSLRIWTGNNVTKVSKVGLVGTNYTLNDIEALPQGTYSWSVQAVDGADNESGWTEPRSFRIGVIPLWAFIIIIVVVAGGIGAVIYFRVIRQRIYYY